MTEKVVCFDGEGVIWHRGHPIEGSVECIEAIRGLGLRTLVITNNASKSVSQYFERFGKSGFKSFAEDDIITSAAAVGRHLQKLGLDKPNRKVFVIGTAGFVSQLRISHITVITAADFDGIDFHTMELDPAVVAVVVGSSEEFTYKHLAIATRFVIENDARLISANPDNNYPYNHQVLVPGAHALAISIARASGRDPEIVGKPDPEMFQSIPGYENIDKANSWMIGDRLNTDIKFAKNVGLRSILVLTGVAKKDDVYTLSEEERPDFICNNLTECFETIQRELNK